MADERLAEYERRRDVRKSGEPARGRRRRIAAPRFVIQRHEARRLHFDFRLEVDGVLVSWAVPRGPSPDPSEKRLAARTEDHPLDYVDFEGRIPAGEYGAGTVIVWDTGHYENLTTSPDDPMTVAEAIEHGHVKVRLHGERLTGAYALTRIGADERAWLLVKVRDEAVDRTAKPAETEFASVRSGRTNAEL